MGREIQNPLENEAIWCGEDTNCRKDVGPPSSGPALKTDAACSMNIWTLSNIHISI